MEFRLDSHTHTLASGHAYCTLLEMVRAAADRGLELICITDHAPGMELTTHKDYFLNFRVIDREIYGVRVMMGAELNVMDFDGTVDLSPNLLICVAIYPAPYPLSMLTTAIPFAQELIIVSRADNP